MDDIYYMEEALKLAKKAYEVDEIPVGCVIVCDNKIIARGYNRKELDKIATYHAEIMAINVACKELGSWRLDNCVLYTTMEPCMMCTGAILQARIPRVVYGIKNEAFGFLSEIKNAKIEINDGVLENRCLELLTDFFREKRK